MKQLDLQVIQPARDWLATGKSVWLCTVLSTFGSAPRGPGAMLVALSSVNIEGRCPAAAWKRTFWSV